MAVKMGFVTAARYAQKNTHLESRMASMGQRPRLRSIPASPALITGLREISLAHYERLANTNLASTLSTLMGGGCEQRVGFTLQWARLRPESRRRRTAEDNRLGRFELAETIVANKNRQNLCAFRKRSLPEAI